MRKIGVYLSAEPYFGGTYQYNLSIIDALAYLDREKYEIFAFYYDESWEPIIPNYFLKVRSKKPSILHRIASKFYRLIDSGDEGLRRFDAVFNYSARLINKSQCEIVIYPSQDKMSYLTSKKSLTSIHDLMHRYESHFEEYQNKETLARDKHYRMICAHSCGILVDSFIGKRQVVESYGLEANRIYRLPFVPPSYLLESNEVEIFKKYDIPEKYIFYPAQFWEHKNHIRLIEAINILKVRKINVNLVLVGSRKNAYKRVLKKIAEFSLEERIKILGYVSNDEIFTLYKNAIAMVFASIIGPTNIPPVEAMLCGCPLICSNAYAMPEQTGDAALLFDPLDSIELANCIERVWTDSNLRTTLKNKGYEKIKEYNQTDFNILLKEIIDSNITDEVS